MKFKIGWKMMGIPWLSDASFTRGMAKNNWHARLYHFGSRLCGR